MMPRYVMQEDWDFFIVLDACRYDYFEQFHRDYLAGGRLEKAVSPATWTLSWAEKNFPDTYDDIVYISTLPFINSITEVSWHGNRFDARKHFFKVVDAWDTAWDEDLRAVPPEQVSEIALREMSRHPEKRFIIHYCQPHAPYLKYIGLNRQHYSRERNPRFRQDTIEEKVKVRLADILMRIGGTEMIWKLNKIFRFMRPRYLEFIWRHLGRQGIVTGYAFNLVRVLQEIAAFLPYLSGRAVITADHGELLGDDRLYGHGDPLPPKPGLVEVPWYTVECTGEKQNRRRAEADVDERARISAAVEKLRRRDM